MAMSDTYAFMSHESKILKLNVFLGVSVVVDTERDDILCGADRVFILMLVTLILFQGHN